MGVIKDAKDDSSRVEGGDIACFIEGKSAEWALRQYGIEVERRPYLFITKKEIGLPIQMGDIIEFQGEPLEVAFAPTIHDYSDGSSHAETMLVGKRTGGRRL